MPDRQEEARRKPRRAARAASAPQFHLPTLEQRQLDLIGLGLVALGLFFAFLVYLGWDGGRAGSEAVDGLRWLLGAAHYLVPVALVRRGAILMLRPVLPAVRPFRAGGDLPVRRASRSAWRPARSASARAGRGRTGGTPSGSRPAAGWRGRRSTGSSRRCAGTSARTSSRSSCSSPACCC